MGRTPFMSQSFKMRAALPLLAALALPLGACQTGAENRSMDSVHQPVVSRTDYVFDVRPNASGELSSGEMERLDGWFSSIGLAYGDRVSIDNPDSYANAGVRDRSEEHTSELQSLMRISYAGFCFKKKN